MDEKYTYIKERLLYYAKNQGFKIESFLDSIGMTYGSFKGKAKEGSLNSSAIAEIYTKYTDLNIGWLLTGNGEMLITNNTTEAVQENSGIDYKELAESRKETIESKNEQIQYLKEENARLKQALASSSGSGQSRVAG
ncbi:hypothetical protein BWK63_12880 [Flavobacterium covae]|uniref:hypothetical protein n=1 Tax=Flavobacterium TaxID=237 RepID=UPI000B4D1FD0|nr:MULTISPECIES: hypothetical protein [Flavobacterium]OWP80078.1 hypothetical protein BWK63_12880 [Flavobacterium covae]POR20613.1 hypothetical protein BWK57_12920 [Flavobacterium columnare]